VPDFIALRGDPSDRIPGARGVGAKTAADLLKQYGSLEKALKAGRFAAQAEELRLYRRIATLDASAPLPPLEDQTPTWAEASALVERWGLRALGGRFLERATAGGAQVLTGGERDGNTWQPTILTNLREDMRVSCDEVFAPVVGVYEYGDVADAISAADASAFGLQAGLFTHDLRVVEQAFDEIDVGGLIVNDVPTFRVDHMPYGGVKGSGTGREGLRYAIEEMTELKLLAFAPGRT
jgi:hypothetical protein